MKRLINFKLIFSCVVLLCATSCTTYYVPNSQEIPLFTKKNQGRVNLEFVAYPELSKAFKISGAYSFADNFAATGNVFMISEIDDEKNSYYKSSHRGYSVGLGLINFIPIGKIYVFETTVGFAGGNAKNGYINGGSIENKVNFVNFFIQPAIGLVKDRFEMAISLKYNIHTYTDLNLTLINSAKNQCILEQSGAIYYDYPIDKTFYFLEPAITVRYGWEHIKISLQIVPSIIIGNVDFARENANASLGIHFKFGNNRLSTSKEY